MIIFHHIVLNRLQNMVVFLHTLHGPYAPIISLSTDLLNLTIVWRINLRTIILLSCQKIGCEYNIILGFLIRRFKLMKIYFKNFIRAR